MAIERRILCGDDIAGVQEPDSDTLRMHLYGESDEDHRIRLTIEQLQSRMYKEIPDRFRDLMDLATYVYAADQAIKRGGKDVETFGDNWRRRLNFEIPVRDFDFWGSDEICELLQGVLGFLSDDHYHFSFRPMTSSQPFQTILLLNEDGAMCGCPERVTMFSGGLDSLGGAVDEILNQSQRVVLVNHRATQKFDKRYRRIADLIDGKAGRYAPCHIRLTVNEKAWMNKEYTQRTRSFLFAAIGATIANMLGINALRFYENGIISLNLPVCSQVVGGKATRTTHPKVLDGFRRLFTLMTSRSFAVDNPFIWKTKGEVLKVLADAQCHDLIRESTSCAHVWEMSNEHSHCGMCSQCIDRRFAVLAAGLEGFDPVAHYKFDCFTESRSKHYHVVEDKTMMGYYIERANRVDTIGNGIQFVRDFPEALRSLPYVDRDRNRALDRCLDLYQRHCHEVESATERAINIYSRQLRKREMSADCFLRVICESSLPISVPSVPEARHEMPENIWRRRGFGWEVRFDGQEPITVVPCLGAHYVWKLLSDSGRHHDVIEAEAKSSLDLSGEAISIHEAIETGLQSSVNPLLAGITQVSDWNAVKKYREELTNLRAERDRAKAENDDLLIGEIDQSIHEISKHLNSILKMGRKQIKKAKDVRKSALDAFRDAIKRMIANQIKDPDPKLADYLLQQITYRDGPMYSGDGRTWATEPISPSLGIADK